jgi:hypothetical protein
LFHVICAELVEPGKGKSPYFFVKDSMFSLKKTESRPPTDIMGEIQKQSIICLWGLTAQRGWARLIHDRLDALVHNSVAPTHGNAAGHVDDAAEHNNFFYPDHGNGTANSAGFGSRGVRV